MYLLIGFSFLAGLVTILSPCILPLLPIILAGGTPKDKHRPLGVILGFITSFTFFTLALSSLVKSTGLSANSLRHFAVFILLIFGLTLTVPTLKHLWEKLTSRLGSTGSSNRHGFGGGFIIGLSLGLVWTPCVGPILASVITLAATGQVTGSTTLITLAYSLGTAIPLFLIMHGTSWFMSRFSYLKNNSNRIQQLFGLFMLLSALMLYFQLDRKFQAYILEKFPIYGAGLTSLEDTKAVKENLQKLKERGGNMQSKLDNHGRAPELIGGQTWLNTTPLTLQELREKDQVVLIDFWTYSCINCIRTLPYLKAWDNKYRPQGLVIIGVHSPEFEFEKDLNNLKRAVEDFELMYPIVQDNDFNIWRAFNNHYWPAKYLIDKEGNIRYTHFGEGKYAETEQVIQELLGEEGELVNMPEYKHETRSPETYLGYWRLTNVVSSPRIVHDQQATYLTPDSFPTNSLGFDGPWTVYEKHATPEPGSSLYFRFDAKEVNLVMRPINSNKTPKVEVFLDGQSHLTLEIPADQLYNLVTLDQGENHTIQITFPEGNVEVYAFTFG